MIDLNENGQVVSPTKTMATDAAKRLVNGVVNNSTTKTATKDAPCALCGHYDDNPEGKGVSPLIIILQTFGGVLAGIALGFVNLYILPNGTWDTRETAAIGVFLISPSIVLLVILFGLQAVGLQEAWFKMVVWIIGSCSMILVLMVLNDWLLELPSLTGGML